MPLELKGEWEVALTEISYTVDWYNIPHNMDIQIVCGDVINETMLVAGHYGTIEFLMDQINLLFSSFTTDFEKVPMLIMNSVTRKVSLLKGESHGIILDIFFPDELAFLLGFSTKLKNKSEYNLRSKRHNFTDKVVEADFPYEITGGLHSMYIYSDIVKPSFVGDTYAQLLRVINVDHKSKWSEQTGTTFNNLNYHQVSGNAITTIEVSLKDDTGDLFPFQGGRTWLTLHFRKKSI
jgi:hypothetical protein